MTQREVKFGKNLMYLRNSNKMTQQQLADVLHVTRQTISVWENGQGNPDIYHVIQICKHFHISPDAILLGTIPGCEEAEDVFDGFTINTFAIGNINTCDYDIKHHTKKGFYCINHEDIQEYVALIEIREHHIIAMALKLKKLGYEILDANVSGFSIYLRSDEEALRFQKDIYDIKEAFLHGDDEYLEVQKQKVLDITIEAHEKIFNNTMAEILGQDMSEIKHFWVDNAGNIRGYASTREQCRQQAKEQECNNYTVLDYM